MQSELVDLAGYLTIHRMKTCMAMMFSNPDRRTRLLLSYFLVALQSQYTLTLQATLLKSAISLYKTEYEKIATNFKAGLLQGNEALELAKELKQKAQEAQKKLSNLEKVSI